MKYTMTLCFWTCSSVNMFLKYKWETKHYFLTLRLISYNILDIHVPLFEHALFLLYRTSEWEGGGMGVWNIILMICNNSESFFKGAVPVNRQRGNKTHFILIIPEISRYRIEISQDSCHRPKTTSVKYQQQN